MARRNCSRRFSARRESTLEARSASRNFPWALASRLSWWRKSDNEDGQALIGKAACPRLGYVQAFVEQQDVGVGAGAQRALLEFDTEQRRGIQRQHAQRVGERDAEIHDVAQRAIERSEERRVGKECRSR